MKDSGIRRACGVMNGRQGRACRGGKQGDGTGTQAAICGTQAADSACAKLSALQKFFFAYGKILPKNYFNSERLVLGLFPCFCLF